MAINLRTGENSMDSPSQSRKMFFAADRPGDSKTKLLPLITGGVCSNGTGKG